MASIYVYDFTSTSFKAQLIGLQTSGITYTRRCVWNVREASSYNTVHSLIEYITAGESEGVAHNFSSLSANTNYVVSCTVYNHDTGSYLDDFSKPVTTSSGSGGGEEPEEPDEPDVPDEPTVIPKWDWEKRNGTNATLEETIDAWWALCDPDLYGTLDFSHKVWNDMVDKLYDLIVATTNWWDSKYGNYINTKFATSAIVSEYELTARRFNALRHNLNFVGDYCGIGGIDIGAVEPNDTVYASYFFEITDFMNRCIENL